MDNNLLQAYKIREQLSADKTGDLRRERSANSVCPQCQEALGDGIRDGKVCEHCGADLTEAGPEQMKALRTKPTNNQKPAAGLAEPAEVTAPNLKPEESSLATFLPDLQDIKTAVDQLIQQISLTEPDILKLYATGETEKADEALKELSDLWNQQIGAYRLWYNNSGGKESIVAAPVGVQQVVARFHEDIRKASEKLSELHRVKNKNSDHENGEGDKNEPVKKGAPTPDELEEKEAELKAREEELNKKEKQLLKDREDLLDKKEQHAQGKAAAQQPAKAEKPKE